MRISMTSCKKTKNGKRNLCRLSMDPEDELRWLHNVDGDGDKMATGMTRWRLTQATSHRRTQPWCLYAHVTDKGSNGVAAERGDRYKTGWNSHGRHWSHRTINSNLKFTDHIELSIQACELQNHPQSPNEGNRARHPG